MGDDFKSRLDAVRARIERAARRAGRDPGCVTLVAVSKSVPIERLREAASCGCRVFGENRVQEALLKMEEIGARAPGGIAWHLIGPLQTNKIKAAVGRFALLHAVDRLEVAERLDRAARERGLTQAVLLEVNVAGETTKHGFSPDELVHVTERMGAFQGIRVLGLMAIPPAAGAPEEARPHFRRLRLLAAEVQALKIPDTTMQELSMGTSGDFEVAVEEGATLVRIGTALFGPRPVG
jgi:pyridoxal phosphate enzyme (YggS family)